MDKFGHFFEFFAALNSAYIVSDLFLRIITTKINNHFNTLADDFKKLKNSHNEYENILLKQINLQEQPKAVLFEKPLQSLTVISRDIQVRLDKFNEDISISKTKCSLSKNFNYLCLYSSLYCILILILNGFEFEFDTPFKRESFLLFNLASIAMLFWLMREKKKWVWVEKKPSYMKIVVIFFLSLLIFPIFYAFELMFPFIDCNYDFKIINISFSLLIPTSHFLYYFFNATKKTKRECQILRPIFREILRDSNQFMYDVNKAFSIINDVELMPSNAGAEK